MMKADHEDLRRSTGRALATITRLKRDGCASTDIAGVCTAVALKEDETVD